jgi:hypothetical protein
MHAAANGILPGAVNTIGKRRGVRGVTCGMKVRHHSTATYSNNQRVVFAPMNTPLAYIQTQAGAAAQK